MSNGPLVRGIVALVEIPYLDATQAVKRPALVVSDTSQMLDVIVAGITSRIRNPLPATHYVIDRRHRDWAASGLRLNSAVRCDRLFTVEHAQILRTLGSLSPATMVEIDALLKRALGMA
jgi:mRNA-degrading endonuclease toxin of MazEF toxin-antitoxin module